MDARRMLTFIDASPSPFHACATAAERLASAGFTRLAEPDAWPEGPGRHFVQRGGSLVHGRDIGSHGAKNQNQRLGIRVMPFLAYVDIRGLDSVQLGELGKFFGHIPKEGWLRHQ